MPGSKRKQQWSAANSRCSKQPSSDGDGDGDSDDGKGGGNRTPKADSDGDSSSNDGGGCAAPAFATLPPPSLTPLSPSH